MVKVDVPNAPADTIVQVAHVGYKIGDRVLRPAAVIVAKGSPASDAKPGSMPPGGGKAQPDQGAAETQAQRPQADAKAGEPRRQRNESGGEPDPQRSAAPEGARRAGPQDKRTSNMTKPVTEGGPPRKDEFISTFGKRLEN
jgi:molecular chaperone GrpE